MRPFGRVSALVILFASFTRLTSAGPIPIHVFNERNTVSIYAQYLVDWSHELSDYEFSVTTSRTTSSVAAVADSVNHEVDGYAIAEASAFNVFVDASAGTLGPPREGKDVVSGATAMARSVVEFSPIFDVSGEIAVQAIPGWSTWTAGAITLQNLTTGGTIWDVGWDAATQSVYGHDFRHSPLAMGPAFLNTTLSASDRYRLTTTTRIGAQQDSGHMRLSVNGLVTVPEPGTWLLLALGCAAAFRAFPRARTAALKTVD